MTSSPGVNTLNLYQRLVAVQCSVEYLRKDQQGDRFQFVSSSQVLGAIREAMNAHGLVLAVRVDAHNLIAKWGNHDAKEHMTELCLTFTWVNSDDPEQRLECPFYGQGLDTGEKGVGKALTYAEKYFLLKFFHIPTDKDDPDAFQERTEAAKPKEPPIGQPGFDKLVALTAKVAETIGRDRKQLWGEVLQVARETGQEQVRALTVTQAAQVEAWLKSQEPAVEPEDIFDGGADAARLPIPQGGE